jgi:hypothetical protein
MGIPDGETSSTQMEKTRQRQKDKAHRGDDGMCRDLDSAAEGNDYDKIKKNGVIVQAVLPILKVVPCQKIQVAGEYGKKYIKMKFIAFSPLVFGKHAHPNHDIPYGGQDGKKYSEKAGIEEYIF